VHQLIRPARQEQLDAPRIGVVRKGVRPSRLGDAAALARPVEVVPHLVRRLGRRAIPGAVPPARGEGLDVLDVLAEVEPPRAGVIPRSE
jgi:hypothetical protein